MDLGFDWKLLLLGLPAIGVAWKWLRSHNDKTLAPPTTPVTDTDIERLVREGKAIEAIKAIRKKYGCGLQQAKAHYDTLLANQRRKN